MANKPLIRWEMERIGTLKRFMIGIQISTLKRRMVLIETHFNKELKHWKNKSKITGRNLNKDEFSTLIW